ncbi:glycoside hydrolase family 15 protein [Coralloluteibacterium thermophilus]|uniref:Glycoside hydrolase family 15 protein n=1 Tax=Coralloluteibacterium thermophilum TaxID=2707049 RepID=A0ABV9NNH7_9GAMM
MPARIEDYAMLGNCRSAALVCRDGSIDWLCLPRFDSDAMFAALLGGPEHGRWSIRPWAPARSTRSYRDASLILETVFEDDHGAVALIDFMVTGKGHEEHSHLVRIVRGLRGRMRLHMALTLRFNYGRTIPWITRQDDGITAIAGREQVVLRSPQTLCSHDLVTESEIELAAGESTWFVLGHGTSHRERPGAIDPERALAETERFWRDWSQRCTPAGRWTDEVRRSLVVLKGLSYLPTGAIVAAPTTSLPEKLGGTRNWDYRYCWLRDAVFTLVALLTAGYVEEAAAFKEWTKRAVAGSPDQLQALYAVGGERRIDEWTVDWLPGYEGSAPVRIGNAAARQFQLDIYGELVGAFYYAQTRGLAPPQHARDLMRAFLNELERRWREPDEGIWEIRNARRHFVHSKVMAWLAFDCGARDGVTDASPATRARWRALAEEIREEVLRCGVHRDGYFVQSYGSEALDASLLLIPLVGFLPPDDPRVAATADAIAERLTVDGLVLRYDTADADDGLPGDEGTFIACSFWLVDNYALLGRLDEARALFARLLGLCNDVGLLAEEYDPRADRMLGNFPQGYSHVALVNSAYRLAAAEAGAATRGDDLHP